MICDYVRQCVRACVSEEGSEGEEEAWLVAMEKGQLDETGYVPRRPGTALTARQVLDSFLLHSSFLLSPFYFPSILVCRLLSLSVQKAMLGSTDEQLLQLPLGESPSPSAGAVALTNRQSQQGDD